MESVEGRRSVHLAPLTSIKASTFGVNSGTPDAFSNGLWNVCARKLARERLPSEKSVSMHVRVRKSERGRERKKERESERVSEREARFGRDCRTSVHGN